MARNYQSSMQFLSISLCFECMTGCVLLSAEACVEQTPSSTASSFSDNVSSINMWGALKVSMSALHCPAMRESAGPQESVACELDRELYEGVLNWQSLQESYSSIRRILK